MRPAAYVPAIDWLKVFGITIILLGHLAGGYTNNLAPPIYPKQLGVAFFVFATAYSLARQTRPGWEVVFNRMAEIWLWGLAIAALVSVETYATRGTVAASNYLPFLLGVNVALNHFPANPTTWYIGTYLHLLLLWWCARRLRMDWRMFALIVAIEIACRYVLIERAGLFIAYMALPNWIAVFAAGYWAGQQQWSPRVSSTIALPAALALAAGAYYGVWPLIGRRSFPFMLLASGSPRLDILATSCLVSLLYLGWTLLVWLLFWSVAVPGWARFIARNTLIVFVAHMPLFFWLDPKLVALGMPYPFRSAVELLVCLPGLALVSEGLNRVLPVREWRDSIRDRFAVRLHRNAALLP